MNQHLADLLDECVSEVRAGRVTAEQCLAAHPDEAGALAPLLALAVRLDPRAIPAPDAVSRARITAHVRRGMAVRRRPWWRIELPHASQRLAAGAIGAIVVLLFVGAGLLTAASRRALPGDPLYALKLKTERVEMALRHDDPVDEHARLAGRRLDELHQLIL